LNVTLPLINAIILPLILRISEESFKGGYQSQEANMTFFFRQSLLHNNVSFFYTEEKEKSHVGNIQLY
jgi:hypothetical protein